MPLRLDLSGCCAMSSHWSDSDRAVLLGQGSIDFRCADVSEAEGMKGSELSSGVKVQGKAHVSVDTVPGPPVAGSGSETVVIVVVALGLRDRPEGQLHSPASTTVQSPRAYRSGRLRDSIDVLRDALADSTEPSGCRGDTSGFETALASSDAGPGTEGAPGGGCVGILSLQKCAAAEWRRDGRRGKRKNAEGRPLTSR